MEKEKTQISLTLAENESVIRTWCENCDDIQIRPMKLGKTGGTGALLIYVEVAVSCVMLKDSVIGKLLNRLMEVPEADIPGVLSENQLGISDAVEFDTMEAAFASMLAGNAILFVDHYDRAVKIGSKGYPNLGVQKRSPKSAARLKRGLFRFRQNQHGTRPQASADHRSESGGDTFWCAF